MRAIFCNSMVHLARRQPSMVFLTGDLGFMALEPLKEALNQRFINAGVAEQNMVSVAAGLARNGLRPWVYSIAPFIYARPFEQIRNDLCLHRVPVVVVGNGGGYGYGVMGATHHALEDYGVLLTLQGMKAYLPAFDEDVAAIINSLGSIAHPAYLRLGLSELPNGQAAPAYQPWRCLVKGGQPWVILTTGPLAGGLWQRIMELAPSQRPTLWVVAELPIPELPAEFISDIRSSPNLLVAEEHVAQGGLGQMIASLVLNRGIGLSRFVSRCALGYPGGRYGSQKYHRQESGIDAVSILNFIHDETTSYE